MFEHLEPLRLSLMLCKRACCFIMPCFSIAEKQLHFLFSEQICSRWPWKHWFDVELVFVHEFMPLVVAKFKLHSHRLALRQLFCGVSPDTFVIHFKWSLLSFDSVLWGKGAPRVCHQGAMIRRIKHKLKHQWSLRVWPTRSVQWLRSKQLPRSEKKEGKMISVYYGIALPSQQHTFMILRPMIGHQKICSICTIWYLSVTLWPSNPFSNLETTCGPFCERVWHVAPYTEFHGWQSADKLRSSTNV